MQQSRLAADVGAFVRSARPYAPPAAHGTTAAVASSDGQKVSRPRDEGAEAIFRRDMRLKADEAVAMLRALDITRQL